LAPQLGPSWILSERTFEQGVSPSFKDRPQHRRRTSRKSQVTPLFEAIAAKAAGQKFTDEEWRDICIRHDNYFL
jgi:hypothetical protein